MGLESGSVIGLVLGREREALPNSQQLVLQRTAPQNQRQAVSFSDAEWWQPKLIRRHPLLA